MIIGSHCEEFRRVGAFFASDFIRFNQVPSFSSLLHGCKVQDSQFISRPIAFGLQTLDLFGLPFAEPSRESQHPWSLPEHSIPSAVSRKSMLKSSLSIFGKFLLSSLEPFSADI